MSGWGPLVSLVLTSLAVLGSPGPATISVTAVGSAFGVRRTLPYLAGLVIGTLCVLLIVATGVTTVLLSVPLIAPALIVASLAYIAYLAVKIATAPPHAAVDPAAVAPPLWGGIVLGVGNPKAYFAIAAVFAANRLVEAPAADAVAKTVVLSGMIVAIHVAWLFVGATIASALRDPVKSRVFNVALAIALVGFSVFALLPRVH